VSRTSKQLRPFDTITADHKSNIREMRPSHRTVKEIKSTSRVISIQNSVIGLLIPIPCQRQTRMIDTPVNPCSQSQPRLPRVCSVHVVQFFLVIGHRCRGRLFTFDVKVLDEIGNFIVIVLRTSCWPLLPLLDCLVGFRELAQ